MQLRDSKKFFLHRTILVISFEHRYLGNTMNPRSKNFSMGSLLKLCFSLHIIILIDPDHQNIYIVLFQQYVFIIINFNTNVLVNFNLMSSLTGIEYMCLFVQNTITYINHITCTMTFQRTDFLSNARSNHRITFAFLYCLILHYKRGNLSQRHQVEDECWRN
jgi:hypothetical protein